MMTTFNKVKELLAEQLGSEDHEMTMDAHIINDLGADSLDQIELIIAAEEEFGVEIPDEDAAKLQTVGDAVRYIDSKIG